MPGGNRLFDVRKQLLRNDHAVGGNVELAVVEFPTPIVAHPTATCAAATRLASGALLGSADDARNSCLEIFACVLLYLDSKYLRWPHLPIEKLDGPGKLGRDLVSDKNESDSLCLEVRGHLLPVLIDISLLADQRNDAFLWVEALLFRVCLEGRPQTLDWPVDEALAA